METSKKPTTIIIILLVVLIILVLFVNRSKPAEVQITQETPTTVPETETKPTPIPAATKPAPVVTTTSPTPVKKAPYDTKNLFFIFDGRQVKLTNGFALITAGDPSNNESVQHIGYETIGDFNGDKKSDVAFLVTRQNKNAGPLYYVLAVISTEDGSKVTNMVIIGDRITMQSVKFDPNTSLLSINYLQRKQDQPITTAPSVPTTLVLKVNGANELEKVK